MNALVVFIILFGGLFGLAYIMKRRFGVLGLALCAGSLLSASWTNTLTPWIESQGVQTVSPPLSAVVSTFLVLLPPLILLFNGPTYSATLSRVVGSLAFAFLAFTFLLGPIGVGLTLDPIGYQIYTTLSQLSNIVTVVGIAAALADVLLTRKSGHAKKLSH